MAQWIRHHASNVRIASSSLVSSTLVQAYEHSLCSGLHPAPVTESARQGGSRCGARLPGSRPHTRSINMPRHDPGSWAVLGDRLPAGMGITMVVLAHTQGHACTHGAGCCGCGSPVWHWPDGSCGTTLAKFRPAWSVCAHRESSPGHRRERLV